MGGKCCKKYLCCCCRCCCGGNKIAGGISPDDLQVRSFLTPYLFWMNIYHQKNIAINAIDVDHVVGVSVLFTITYRFAGRALSFINFKIIQILWYLFKNVDDTSYSLTWVYF